MRRELATVWAEGRVFGVRGGDIEMALSQCYRIEPETISRHCFSEVFVTFFLACMVSLLVVAPVERAEADALAEIDYLGDWELVYFSENDAWAKILKIEKTSFLLCESDECTDPLVGNTIYFVEDLIVLASRSENRNVLRLVLGGYKNSARTVLFGTRYHYREGTIISGIPMIYEKKKQRPGSGGESEGLK